MAGVAASFRHRASAILSRAASTAGPIFSSATTAGPIIPVAATSGLISSSFAADCSIRRAASTAGPIFSSATTAGAATSGLISSVADHCPIRRAASTAGPIFSSTTTAGPIVPVVATSGPISSSVAAAASPILPFLTSGRTQTSASIHGRIPCSDAVHGRRLSSTATIRRLSSVTFNPLLRRRHLPPLVVRRFMSTEGVPPEVEREIERLRCGNVARHRELMSNIDKFQTTIMNEYSAAALARGEAAFQVGKVAWRVSFAVLVFGVATIITVIQTVKEGWISEFDSMARQALAEMMEHFKKELIEKMKQFVRECLKEEKDKKE